MSFQPKRFYRTLDGILRSIGGGAADRAWFDRILHQIVEHFGDQLGIASGRLYRGEEDGFRLERDIHSRDPQVTGLLVPNGYRPLELVREHGVYVFDPSTEGQDPSLEDRLGGFDSAALLVESRPPRILAFGLQPGWDRVHLDFALNTIRNAIHQKLRMQEVEGDFAQAAEIQRSLLPHEIPEFPGYSVAARMQAAAVVGGDLYDFQTDGPHSLYVTLGDVSGHGLPSALLARDVVTGLRMGAERELKITSILGKLNRVIARSILSSRFVSLFFGELETNGNLFYVNAGHIAPWIFGRRGTRRLTRGGTILGPVVDTVFQRGFAHVDRGDTLVVVTDGLVERENLRGEEFGEAGIERVVAPLVGGPAQPVVETIFSACDRHGQGRFWNDDATVLAITRFGSAENDEKAEEP